MGICNAKAPPEAPLLLDAPDKAGAPLEWVSARMNAEGKEVHRIKYSAEGMEALVRVRRAALWAPHAHRLFALTTGLALA